MIHMSICLKLDGLLSWSILLSRYCDLLGCTNYPWILSIEGFFLAVNKLPMDFLNRHISLHGVHVKFYFVNGFSS